MRPKLIILSFSIYLLLSCKIVEVYDYTHEPTHYLRDRIVWKSGDISVPHHTNEPILFIPNLRTFSLSFSSPRFVRLNACSMQPEKFVLARVILKNDDSKYEIEKKFNQTILVEKKMFGRHNFEYEHFCNNIRLFKDENINYQENFSGAKSLILKIYYRYPNSSVEKERIFKIKLKKNKEIAWPT